MNLSRELFSTAGERDAVASLAYDAGEWMPARLGKAWPPRGRVMIYLAFGLENDFLRYRIAVLEAASSEFSQRDSQALRSSCGEPWRGARALVARSRDHFISQEETAPLT